MDDTLFYVLMRLDKERDELQEKYDVLAQAAEDARRACVPAQQRLAKIKDAIASINHALEWKLEGGA